MHTRFSNMSDTMAMRRPAATAPPPPASFDADLPSDPPMESVLDQAWNRVDERLAAAAAGLPEIDIAAVQTQVRGDVPETILLRGGTELAVALEMATGAFCERRPRLFDHGGPACCTRACWANAWATSANRANWRNWRARMPCTGPSSTAM